MTPEKKKGLWDNPVRTTTASANLLGSVDDQPVYDTAAVNSSFQLFKGRMKLLEHIPVSCVTQPVL